MTYNIAAFTDIGTHREINQDRILVQGHIYEGGIYSFDNLEKCFCLVADGIGGGSSGELASQFVLEEINTRINHDREYSREELTNILRAINSDLIKTGKDNPDYRGSGTTLVGLIIRNHQFRVINAGDSQAWVFRNGTLLKLTEDHVLDSLQVNSPITSYFGIGGDELYLDFGTVLRNVLVGDILLLTSDGLFKSLTQKHIKAILSNSKSIEEKTKFILQKVLEKGAEDNISCILIEVAE